VEAKEIEKILFVPSKKINCHHEGKGRGENRYGT
jgi:hypothetical protein